MRIYVSTYKKYNAGSLAGAWLDLDAFEALGGGFDRDAFMAAARELHSDEQDPELMYQDAEDIPGQLVPESGIDFDKLDAYITCCNEYDQEVANALLEHLVPLNAEISIIPRDSALTAEESIGYYFAAVVDSQIPEHLTHYFDWHKYGQDIMIDSGNFILLDDCIIEVLS